VTGGEARDAFRDFGGVGWHRCPGIGTERVLSGTKMISHVLYAFAGSLALQSSIASDARRRRALIM